MSTITHFERVWQALTQQHLTLDQTSTPLEIDRAEVEQFYHPLALELIRRGQAPGRAAGSRLLAAIAGPPGSGKTAFATLLAAVINVERKSEQAVAIPQDGWHYPNAYLDTHSIQRQGQTMPLRQLKGAPETYDTPAAYAFLERVRRGETLRYPLYSRERHDPIPEAGLVGPDQHWIILEGNYWLLNEPDWQPFQALFDVTIFLTADPASLIDGLRQRHLRGGKDPAFIEQHMQQVDVPNIQRVLDHSGPAQIVVEKKDSRQIASISYHPTQR